MLTSYTVSASKPLPKKVGLTVKDVDRFSYGEFDDGEVALWAAGKAGWFEIEPSTKYKPVYDNMVEALKVYYFVAAKYRDQKPKKREKYIGSAETLFNEAGFPILRLHHIGLGLDC